MQVFSIADYEEEEQWLTEMAAQGYKLIKINVIFFTFEVGESQQLIYRIEYNRGKDDNYLQMIQDYGWTPVCENVGFNYYCRVSSQQEDENEIFSDNESRIDMISKIQKTRLFPLMGCTSGSIVTLSLNNYRGPIETILLALVLLEVVLFVYCTLKLKRKKRELQV